MQRTVLLAKQMNAEVMFLHIVSRWQSERALRIKANRARAQLMTQVDKVMSHAPESACAAIHTGRTLGVIAEVAESWNADLIVMTTPATRKYERVFGTTAERIVRSAPCPLLIVNRAAAQPYRHVVVAATDRSTRSVRLARTIDQLGMFESKTSAPVAAIEPASLRKDSERLVVIGTGRWLALQRLLSRSVAHQILTSASCDILAVSPASIRRVERKRCGDDQQVRQQNTTMGTDPLLNA